MRAFLCVLLFCSSLAAQVTFLQDPSDSPKGSFYVNGVQYQYILGENYVVVAAADAVINHKFLGVKVRVLNLGVQSLTVKPEDVSVEDTVGGHNLPMISGAELARRMRRPSNWARYAVTPAMGPGDNGNAMGQMMNPAFIAMMQQMQEQGNAGNTVPASNVTAMHHAAPDFVQSGELVIGGTCSAVCQLRNHEASGPDTLKQLEGQTKPEFVEHIALLANTIPPQADVEGVLYYPLPKATNDPAMSKNGRKLRLAHVTVPVDRERFEFSFSVE